MTKLSAGRLTAQIDPTGATITDLYYNDIRIAEHGITIGRFANRIGKGRITVNGIDYEITKNENGNTLHGGKEGFAQRCWAEKSEENCAEYTLVSEDGDQGFPGRLEAAVKYSVSDTELKIEYSAVCDKDTVINFTNHAFFNLNGTESGAAIGSHSLCIKSDGVLEIDSELIPNGRIMPVEGTRFDFNTEKTYTDNYDHCFTLGESFLEKPAAVLKGLKSGITMKVFTDQPAMQLFNTPERICLEAQGYPDAMHHDNFPSPLLKAGEKYKRTIIFSFA